MSSSQESQSSSLSTDDLSGIIVDFQTIEDTGPETPVSLNWEPKRIRGKGTTSIYWILENTRACTTFITAQLKVCPLMSRIQLTRVD
jgi:hypothetical protein